MKILKLIVVFMCVVGLMAIAYVGSENNPFVKRGAGQDSPVHSRKIYNNLSEARADLMMNSYKAEPLEEINTYSGFYRAHEGETWFAWEFLLVPVFIFILFALLHKEDVKSNVLSLGIVYKAIGFFALFILCLTGLMYGINGFEMLGEKGIESLGFSALKVFGVLLISLLGAMFASVEIASPTFSENSAQLSLVQWYTLIFFLVISVVGYTVSVTFIVLCAACIIIGSASGALYGNWQMKKYVLGAINQGGL